MTRTRGRTIALALALVGALAVSDHSASGTDDARWRVRVRPACMVAEDSAAHLRLRVYDATTHTARYGCRTTGY